jgi:hypothetical protein
MQDGDLARRVTERDEPEPEPEARGLGEGRRSAGRQPEHAAKYSRTQAPARRLILGARGV